MDVGFLFVILLFTVIYEVEQKSVKLCKFVYRNCRRTGSRCDISTLYCNNAMKCDEMTAINIKAVHYGTNYFYVASKFCPNKCYTSSGLTYSQTYTRELQNFCNTKNVCDITLWKKYTGWRLHVIYDCQEDTRPVKSPTEATKTQVPTTSPRLSQTTTSCSDTRRVTKSETKENTLSDQFPVPAVAASVTAGVLVLAIVLIVVVCIKRRRRTIKSNQPDETTRQMQIVANNSYGYSTPLANRQDQQETDEHAYVDINLQNATDTSDGTFEHGYVNADKVVNTNDEYNTLKTRPTLFRINPNYEHLPKCSHTTINETYSHVTDGQTTMPDTTYSHLKYIKSATSPIAKINLNNSDNIYNHLNTKSVQENVYNNSQKSFNRSSLSHLGETKAAEDDYDHTDWKQTNTSNSKSKNGGKFEINNITERARDEYAGVKQRSDKVESSAGHNYLVLEKQFM